MSKVLSFLRFVSPLILFALFFGGFFLLFSSAWISSIYGKVTFLQILFHLQFPIDDVDPKFLMSFREHVVFPSVILSAILALSPFAFKVLKLFLRKILKHTKIFYMLKSCTPFFFTLAFFFVIFFALWIYRVYAFYAPTTLDKFLFELKLPEIPLFASFAKRVLFPSTLLSVLIFSVPIYHYCKEAIPRFYSAIKYFLPKFYTALRNLIDKTYACFKRYSRAFVLSAQYGGAIALVLASLSLVDKKFGAFKALFEREDSTLFEEHYKPFALKINSAPKNLIVIFVESLESTFSLKSVINNGGGQYAPFGELLPNLSTLATQHINFSSTQTFGGTTQLAGTGWTIAGLTSYMCAIPLKLPIGGNSFSRGHFLESTTCIGDVLHSLGYTLRAVQGSDTAFSGMLQFFNSHFIPLKGAKYFDEQTLSAHNIDPQTKNGVWGIKDALVLNEGKLFLQEWQKHHPNKEKTQESPRFALFLVTIDTHHPNGFIDKQNCPNLSDETPYQSSILCADKLISEFIDWAQKQDFYKDTTIIVLGDHLSMKQNFFPQGTKRAVFNAFINPSFSTNPQLELIKNRQLSHFDISALILDSIGLEVESFGLGRNPLKSKTLLEEFGAQEFNKALNQSSRFYDSLWKPDFTKHTRKEKK